MYLRVRYIATWCGRHHGREWQEDRRIITDHQEALASYSPQALFLTMNVRKVTADRRLMLTNVLRVRAYSIMRIIATVRARIRTDVYKRRRTTVLSRVMSSRVKKDKLVNVEYNLAVIYELNIRESIKTRDQANYTRIPKIFP